MMRLSALLLAMACTFAARANAELRLAMFEQAGCLYCARWDAEIAPIYPKTPEGQAAPLQRINLRAALPDDVALSRPVVFTPTFVLLDDGVESNRMEGYPGPDFFWPLLAEMIAQRSAPEG